MRGSLKQTKFKILKMNMGKQSELWVKEENMKKYWSWNDTNGKKQMRIRNENRTRTFCVETEQKKALEGLEQQEEPGKVGSLKRRNKNNEVVKKIG